MRSLISEVSRLVGLPATDRKKRKFLLSGVPTAEMFAAAGILTKTFNIEKCYPLSTGTSDAEYTYVRRRASEEGYASYGETRVVVRDGEKLELKRNLSEREYAT